MEDEWGDADILVTANPIALLNKPHSKTSIKIKAPYNSNIKGDYEINSLLEFITDDDSRDKIFNTKTTTYEEL